MGKGGGEVIKQIKRLWAYLMAPPEPQRVSIQQMLSTKEGREQLAEMIAKRYPPGTVKPAFDICPTCEGFGKLGQRYSVWEGGATSFLDGPICTECNGTGIKGGTDYENVTCQQCNGKGAIVSAPMQQGPKCVVCNGTGILKVRKEKTDGTTKLPEIPM